MNNRLFFYANIERDNDAMGITKKVRGQIRAFEELGYKVAYSCYIGCEVAIVDADTNKILASKRFPVDNYDAFHVIRRSMLLDLAAAHLRRFEYDIVYARYHFFDGKTLNFLKAAHGCGAYVVMEMHSYPCLSGKGLKGRVFARLEHRFQDSCVKLVDEFANMSGSELPFDRPQVMIRNTFNQDEIMVRSPLNRCDDRVIILSVAYERSAHGFDRVVRGLSDYYKQGGSRDIQVFFVGRYLDSTKRLVLELGLTDRCTFIPPTSGKALGFLYDISDLAIGHLANHRIGSISGSAIKTQEFLAKGIPFVYAWDEPSLADDFPYALKLKLGEEPISMANVISFADKMHYMGVENVAAKMRAIFDADSGWTKQMGAVVHTKNQSPLKPLQ